MILKNEVEGPLSLCADSQAVSLCCEVYASLSAMQWAHFDGLAQRQDVLCQTTVMVKLQNK